MWLRVCVCVPACVHVCQRIHGAHVRVEAGEHDTALAGHLQDAGQDDVQERVHVEIRGQVTVPRAVLPATTTRMLVPHADRKLCHF